MESNGLPKGFISEAAMSEKSGKCIATLRRWGVTGYGPRRFRIGKTVIYREDGIERWLEGVEMMPPKERPAPRRRGRPATASHTTANPNAV